MMEIHILRHGIAEDAKAGHRDADRALTSEGKKKLRETLKALKKIGLAPSLILTSPYRRAAETAAIAASVLGFKGDIVDTRALIPPSSVEDVWEEIRSLKNENSLLLVGHEPLLSYLVGFLLDSPSLTTDLKKGSVVRVDVEPSGHRPGGVLRWMVVPRLFQRL